MLKYLTTKRAAEQLGVSVRRVQQMTVTPCPMCNGQGKGCRRCKGTGYYLPWEPGGQSGTGTIKLIPRWAIELADVQQRPDGRPVELPGVALERVEDRHYRVIAAVTGILHGHVYREERHKWRWHREGAISETTYSTREEAIKALIVP